MDYKSQNLSVYSKHAKGFADKFSNVGPLTSYIEEVFSLVNKTNPKVLEIGCGTGKDATEILKHTNDYLGIDFSPELLEIAKAANPNGRFEVHDFEEFIFPENVDAVFAIASLIHAKKEIQRQIFERIGKCMNTGGIFFFTAKTLSNSEESKTDQFGTRFYYSYSEDDVRNLAKGIFNIVRLETKLVRGQNWADAILQKI